MKRAHAAVLLFLSMTGLALEPVAAVGQERQPPRGRPRQKSREEVIDAAIAYLKSAQPEDGTWSKAGHPGITAVTVHGLLKVGKVSADDPTVAKALKYLETLVDGKEGHIAAGENLRHKFYLTSVNVQAFKAVGSSKYDAVIAKAVAYLKDGQVGAADGKAQDDPNFGGFGYAPGNRADMSNTNFVLDALVTAGVPRSDAVYRKALVFVSRAQNLKGETNDLPWAGKINDGSFVYVTTTAAGGTTPADAPRPGYGSMTFAGLKSLAICGVAKDDSRYRKALEWIGKHYTVDINPGRAEGAGGQGYYYYLATMAKCLDSLGIDEVTDANGKAHDWRADMVRALAFRQKKDGSWGNDTTTWMEGDPNLDTAFALIALSYTKPKK